MSKYKRIHCFSPTSLCPTKTTTNDQKKPEAANYKYSVTRDIVAMSAPSSFFFKNLKQTAKKTHAKRVSQKLLLLHSVAWPRKKKNGIQFLLQSNGRWAAQLVLLKLVFGTTLIFDFQCLLPIGWHIAERPRLNYVKASPSGNNPAFISFLPKHC